MSEWKRTHNCNEITPELDGKQVTLNGWTQIIRKKGQLCFIVLRDDTGTRQLTLLKKRNLEIFDLLSDISRESVISVTGAVKAFKDAPNGVEIIPEKAVILSSAEPLPYDPFSKDDIDTGKDIRFNYRMLDLRDPKVLAIFKIRSTVLASVTEFMNKNNFVEWATPKIVGASTEGGTEVFPVKWFDEDAFLSMSPQLHKQFIVGNTGTKYYEMTPYFRAEKHRTKRHLSELWGIDMEVPFNDYKDILEIIEQMIVHVFERVKERNKVELEILGRVLPELKLPFRRVTYTEALEMLVLLREESIKTAEKKEDIIPELTWGEDIPDPSELALWNHIKEPFFIVEYPAEIAKFYVMKVPDNPKVAQAYDFIFIRELASGATREHRHEVLIDQIKEKGLDPENFTSYLDAFRYGVAPHAGMGMGVERLLMAITGIDDVMEVVPFPRTIDRLTP